MDTDHLALFVMTAALGSFSAAARRRGVEPSTISRAIASLEKETGLRLFQRSTRHLLLTEAGSIFLARAEGLLAELEEARAAALTLTNTARGRLRVSCPIAFAILRLGPLLGEFARRFPDVSLDLITSDREVDLTAERIDVGVHFGAVRHASHVVTKLFSARYRVVASPTYLARHHPPAQPADMGAHRCLVFDLPGYRDRWRFRDEHGAIERVSIAHSINFDNALALHAAAVAGAGPALIADWKISAELAAGKLVDLFPAHDVTASEFDTAAWLVYPSRQQLPMKVRVFVDFVKAHIMPHPPVLAR